MSGKSPQYVSLGARLDKELVDRIDEVARRQYSTRSGIIRQALDTFFEAYVPPKPSRVQRVAVDASK
jgi:metal-responsive CopG/Arc/MetJ family transcriptional regulator